MSADIAAQASHAVSPLVWNPDAWLALFEHFVSLSLMSIGGAITLVADMHRRLVLESGLLSGRTIYLLTFLTAFIPHESVSGSESSLSVSPVGAVSSTRASYRPDDL